MFDKVLIANRGEIAVRIERACQEMGIATVAVYSDVDRESLHVRLADEAVHVGPAPSSESYLRVDKILEAAKRTGAQAVHPGYGFLAENGAFAASCRDAGITFIGPSPEAMSQMGDKASARALAARADVPTVPGTEPIEDVDEALAAARDIGFPVLVKATAGGGGKGMRRVDDEAEFRSSFQQASSEALSAFGNAAVFLEKFIDKPRHVEIQVLGDQHGHIVHLLERECSIQRRHQKLIEEAPSPFVDEELRERMGGAAVALSREAGYYNAGTVEFLVDDDKNFYFLEMNTRLQVEHPVTEIVAGVDLVRLQLEIAAGGRLELEQNDIRPRGWAMELRITAEDPFANFTPSAGLIRFLRPAEGPGIRHDSGVYGGWEVTPHYDPLIAKLVISGEDREQVLARARRAVREYQVDGIATTLPFFARMLDDARFCAGEMDVSFVDRHWMSEMVDKPTRDRDELLAAAIAVAAVVESRSAPGGPVAEDGSSESSWTRYGRARQLGGRF